MVKLLLGMPTRHTCVPVGILTTLLPIQLPVNASWEAMENGAPTTHVRNMDGWVSGSWLPSGSALAVEGI